MKKENQLSNQLFQLRTMLSYPVSEKFITGKKNVLSNDRKEFFLAMQEKAEENVTILVWLEGPFHFDFRRNKIYTVGYPGLLSDIGGFPRIDLSNANVLKNYLKNLGIRYVIWGYNDAPRAQYKGTHELEQGIIALLQESRIVYDDGQRVMIDIQGQ